MGRDRLARAGCGSGSPVLQVEVERQLGWVCRFSGRRLDNTQPDGCAVVKSFLLGASLVGRTARPCVFQKHRGGAGILLGPRGHLVELREIKPQKARLGPRPSFRELGLRGLKSQACLHGPPAVSRCKFRFPSVGAVSAELPAARVSAGESRFSVSSWFLLSAYRDALNCVSVLLCGSKKNGGFFSSAFDRLSVQTGDFQRPYTLHPKLEVSRLGFFNKQTSIERSP